MPGEASSCQLGFFRLSARASLSPRQSFSPFRAARLSPRQFSSGAADATFPQFRERYTNRLGMVQHTEMAGIAQHSDTFENSSMLAFRRSHDRVLVSDDGNLVTIRL